jgi:acyl-CoA thioester hydrolase
VKLPAEKKWVLPVGSALRRGATRSKELIKMTVYKHNINVSKETIDAVGHVNNVQYIQWMQDAAVQHSDSTGCTKLTEAQGAVWLVRTHNIEYFRPAYVNDQITILTWVSNFRKVRSLRKYKFIRDSDGAILAKGETDWVFVDVNNGKPLRIPAIVMNTFTLVTKEHEP